MNKNEFFKQLDWPEGKEADMGWVLWSTSSLASKGLRATAVQDPWSIQLKVEAWGTDGLPAAPLDANFQIKDNQITLLAGTVVGRVANMKDVLEEFVRFTSQINQKPTFELLPYSAPKPKSV